MKKLMALPLVAAGLLLVLSGCSDKKGMDSKKEEELKGGIYVLNQADGTISIFDWQSNGLVKTYDAHIEQPHHMMMSRNHEFFYAVGRHVPGQISKFRVEDDMYLGKATDGPGTLYPTSLAVSIDGDTGYVTDFSQTLGGVYKMNLQTMQFYRDTTIDTVVVGVDTTFDTTVTYHSHQAGLETHDVKISGDGKLMAACNYKSDNIVVYDVEHDSVITIAPVGIPFTGTTNYGPYGLEFFNDSVLFIACKVSNEVRIFDLTTLSITDSVAIPVVSHGTPSGPTLLYISPNETKLYVSTSYGNSVVVVDLTTRPLSVLADIPVGIYSFGMVSTNSGSQVYVACAKIGQPNGYIYILDGLNDTVLDSIKAGGEPYMVHYHKPHHGSH